MIQAVPYPLAYVDLESVSVGEQVTIPYPPNSPTGVLPDSISLEVLTRPTSRNPVHLSSWSANNSTNQITVVLDSSFGGDLTGAIVRLIIRWIDQGGGGLT
jgi:hypothetical protein